MTSRLPRGWAVTRVDDVADLDIGFAFKSVYYVANGIRLLRGENVEPGALRWGDTRYWSEADLDAYRHLLIAPGDLILAMDRPVVSAGLKLARAKAHDCPCLLVQRVARLRGRDETTAFLHYALASFPFVRHILIGGQTGTQLPHISGTRIQSFEFPIAPIQEQHRIVEAIESHLTRLNDALATLERVERNLKRYRASVLKAAVEGRLVPTEAALAKQERRAYEPASVLLERILAERRRRWNLSGKKGKYQEPAPPDTSNLSDLPEGWCWATLNAISDIQLGQQRAPDHAAAANQIPYVRAANITWAGLDLSDVKSMGFPNPERYELEYGDVLLSEASGSPMEAGKPAIWRDELPGACYQKTVLRIRPFWKTLSIPEFLRVVFLRDCFTGKFARLAPGVGIVHLTAERMIEWPVPLAPIAEQRRILAEVDRHESGIDSAVISVEKQLLRCDRLRQSILKWAFEGKLADQDANDEPASVLLERIKAERAAAAGAETTRSRHDAKKKQVRA